MDLSALEGRFDAAVHDVNDALHSQVAREIMAAAGAILSLFPEGVVIDGILTKLDELAVETHAAADTVTAPASGPTVVTAEGTIALAPDASSTVPGTTPQVTGAATDPTQVVPAPAEPTADAAPALPVEPGAGEPVADPPVEVPVAPGVDPETA